MKVKEVYVSPDDEVLCVVGSITVFYELIVGKWYKIGMSYPGTDANEHVWVVQHDFKCIPYNPELFMSISDWRDRKLKQIGI